MNLSQLSPRKLGLALGAAALLFASPFARAGFVNGGFETGDFSGWTLEYAMNYSGVNVADPISSLTFSSASHGVAPIVVDKSVYSDSFVPGLSSMFLGDKMARINDIDGWYHVTRLSQTGVIDASDLKSGSSASLYVNWVSVLVDPSGHPKDQVPWFNIEVLKDGIVAYSVTHFSTDKGWTYAGQYGYEDTFWGAGQLVLNNLLVGDSITVRMTAADCGWGGHGGYAYLDGIGTSKVPDPHGVPDAASTLGLLGLALAGLVSLRRRR